MYKLAGDRDADSIGGALMVQLFKDSDIPKLRNFVRSAETGSGVPQRGVGRARGRWSDVVKVTSATPSGGYYPAIRQVWNEDDEDWDDDDVCRVTALRGGTPLVQRYLGYSTGAATGGYPLYAIRDPGPICAGAATALTNVCPSFSVVNGQTVVTGVTAETTVLNLPSGYTLGTPFCSDDPLQALCCQEDHPCEPTVTDSDACTDPDGIGGSGPNCPLLFNYYRIILRDATGSPDLSGAPGGGACLIYDPASCDQLNHDYLVGPYVSPCTWFTSVNGPGTCTGEGVYPWCPPYGCSEPLGFTPSWWYSAALSFDRNDQTLHFVIGFHEATDPDTGGYSFEWGHWSCSVADYSCDGPTVLTLQQCYNYNTIGYEDCSPYDLCEPVPSTVILMPAADPSITELAGGVDPCEEIAIPILSDNCNAQDVWPCPVVPKYQKFTLAGVTNNFCLNCATILNTTHYLTYQLDSFAQSSWRVVYHDGLCGEIDIILAYNKASCEWYLEIDFANFPLLGHFFYAKVLTVPADWNCLGSNVLAGGLSMGATICSTAPATVTIEAVA